ncbi:hypothetical protein [Kocuria nitroreducens]|uniref:hypothetical protein n=1 Tax=Kocuria nitroreducens TaxID=3058914 RepID=UPI0036DC97FF
MEPGSYRFDVPVAQVAAPTNQFPGRLSAVGHSLPTLRAAGLRAPVPGTAFDPLEPSFSIATPCPWIVDVTFAWADHVRLTSDSTEAVVQSAPNAVVDADELRTALLGLARTRSFSCRTGGGAQVIDPSSVACVDERAPPKNRTPRSRGPRTGGRLHVALTDSDQDSPRHSTRPQMFTGALSPIMSGTATVGGGRPMERVTPRKVPSGNSAFQEVCPMSTLHTVALTSPSPTGGSCADETPARLRRYRMLVDRPGLKLRAGELVLCADYEPAPHQAVVPVRCESDGYAPGALLSRAEVEFLERTDEVFGAMSWGRHGARP